MDFYSLIPDNTPDNVVNIYESYVDDNAWDEFLRCACRYGHNALIDYAIRNGAVPDEGFDEACECENFDLAKSMIERGASNFN